MIKLEKFQQHPASSLLELYFSDGFHALISYELLRVYSPYTAQTPDFSINAPLVANKAFVKLSAVASQPNLGLTLSFDDNHHSDLMSNEYLYRLCSEQDSLWLTYMSRSRLAQQARNNAIDCLQLS